MQKVGKIQANDSHMPTILSKPELVGFMEMDTGLWPLWKYTVEDHPGEADRLVHVGNTIFENFCREKGRMSLPAKKWKGASIIARLLKATPTDLALDSGRGESFYRQSFFHPDRYAPKGGISYETFPFMEGKGIRREYCFLTGKLERETLLSYE